MPRHSSIASAMSLASFSLAPRRSRSLPAFSSSRSSSAVTADSLAVSCFSTSLAVSSSSFSALSVLDLPGRLLPADIAEVRHGPHGAELLVTPAQIS